MNFLRNSMLNIVCGLACVSSFSGYGQKEQVNPQGLKVKDQPALTRNDMQEYEQAIYQAFQSHCLFKIDRPHEASIAARKKNINTEMRWNQIARLGVQGAKWGIGIFTAYKILQSFGNRSTVAAPVATVQQAKDEVLDNKELTKKLMKLEYKLDPSWFSLQWFKNLGYVMGEHLVAAIAAGTIYKSVDHYLTEGILHKGDISWFIGTKTNLLSNSELLPIVIPMELIMSSAVPLGQLGGVFEKDMTVDQTAMLGKYAALLLPQNNLKKTIFEELKAYASALGDTAANELDQQPLVLIESACNSLVHQIESILGFMEFKQESFSQEAKTQASYSGRYILNATNEFCQKMEQVLNDVSLDGKARKNKVETIINSFKNDIARLLISFSRIEKEHNDPAKSREQV